MSSNSLAVQIFRGDTLVDTRSLDLEVIKIGNLRSSHLRLSDDSVSRMHAVIERSGSDVRLIDLGSTPGTLLNDRRVDRSAALRDGDTIVVGPFRLVVGIPASSAQEALLTAPSPVAGWAGRRHPLQPPDVPDPNAQRVCSREDRAIFVRTGPSTTRQPRPSRDRGAPPMKEPDVEHGRIAKAQRIEREGR